MRIKRVLVLFLLLAGALGGLCSCDNLIEDAYDLSFYNPEYLANYEIVMADNATRATYYDLVFFTTESLTCKYDSYGDVVEECVPYILEPTGLNAEKIKIIQTFFSGDSLCLKDDQYLTRFEVQLDYSDSYSYTEELVEIKSVKMRVFDEIYEAPVNFKIHFFPQDITAKYKNVLNYCSYIDAVGNNYACSAASAMLSQWDLSSTKRYAIKRIFIDPIENIDAKFIFTDIKIKKIVSANGLPPLAEYYVSDMNDLKDENGEYIYCVGDQDMRIHFDVEITGDYSYYKYMTPIYGEIYCADTGESNVVPFGMFTLNPAVSTYDHFEAYINKTGVYAEE